MIRSIFTLAITVATATAALVWQTPADGSADRKALLDARCPQAEESVGAPVEFVVDQARISGSLACVVVSPQRPGGGRIDLDATSLALPEDGYFPTFMTASGSTRCRKNRARPGLSRNSSSV
jgi:hypothetical protein